MHRYYLIIIFLGLSLSLNGQNYQLSEDPEQFPKDLVNLVGSKGDGVIDSTYAFFGQTWQKLSSSQQSTLIKTATSMAQSKVKKPTFQRLVRVINKAQSSNEISSFDQFLNTLQASAQNNDFRSLGNLLNVVDTYLTHGALFKSSYNSLYAKDAQLNFEYANNSAPPPVEEEEPEPEPEPQEDSSEDDWYADWESDSDDDWDTSWDEEPQEEETDVAAVISQDEPQPPLQGALVTFTDADLVFITRNDSATLVGAKGSLMAQSGVFVGEGGRFGWDVAGLPSSEVYADLGLYNFEIDKPYLRAGNAQMTNKERISGTVPGVFEFKSGSGKTRDNSYPRFVSFNEDITIKGIGDELLTYEGGFAMRGNRVYSASLMGGSTKIKIKGKHGSQLNVISRSFQLQDSIITSPKAAVTINHGQDSIYHPAVQFRYDPQEHQVTILKDEGSFKSLSYTSSLFQTYFNADVLRWDMDADSLDVSILSAKNKIPSKFESHEYYNNDKFDALVALYGFNPLMMAVAHARKTKSSEFYSDDMAKRLNQNPEKIRGAMRGLMTNGFIDFNSETGYVKIKRKGYHYVLSKQDRKDFDNIMIPSLSPQKSNATLDLANNEFIIRGIRKFYINELLDVHIRPKNQEITLLEGRDFRFDGFINAGNFQFIGRNFRFDYDSFLIALPKIDSITFSLDQAIDGEEKDVKLGITNQLVETAGVLYINKPNNKSARKIYPEYPIFKADIGAVVYFDDKEILDGAYDKSIYFTIPAFELDSASSSDPSVIKFKGVFTSGGIFPEFEEELTIMEDNSLGFEHKLPYVGFKTYNGTGTVYNKITMDKRGLRSSGKVDFLSTTLHSEDFIYYNDSVTTVGQTAVTKPGMVKEASFPQVSIEKYEMLWFPKTDSMYLRSTENPFQLYDNTATLKGRSLITTEGYFAEGTLSTRGSQSKSDQFQFEEKHLAAEDAQFLVESSDPKKPSLVANGVSLNFDLDNNFADIKSEVEGTSVLNFPFTQIRTSISEARWDLDKKLISMKKAEDVDINQSYFYTTKPEMDSLVFNATEALYDIDRLEMQVSGVPFMNVADARIVPDSNRVLIRENAEIERFRNAQITLDTLNGYHSLYNGDISVTARHAFSGNAIYQYVNATKDTFEIELENFLLVRDKKLKGNQIFTVGTGEIQEKDNIYIMPSTLYKGDVTLYANRRILQMDGFIKLDLKNMPDNDSWLAHSSDSEVQDLVINVSEAVSESGQPLTSGFNIDAVSGEVYGTFISEKRDPTDLEVFNAQGLFSYDSASSEYRVVDANKLKGSALAGNVFAYNDNNTDIRFEGRLNFLDRNTQIGLIASGKGKGNLNDKSVVLNSFHAYQFEVPTKAMEYMAGNVSDIVSRVGAPVAKTDQTSLLHKVADAVGEKAALEYQQRSSSEFISLAAVSPQLARSLVLSSVNMKWSPEYNSWYSVGNLGVSNILENEVNGKLEGFLEIRKNEEGDEFHLFIKASPSTYYYFSYQENRLYLFSSNNDFNSEISRGSKITRAGIGEYAFTTTDMEGMLEFIDRFRRDYMDITEPYEINTFAEEEVLDEDFTSFEEEKDDEDDDADGF